MSDSPREPGTTADAVDEPVPQPPAADAAGDGDGTMTAFPHGTPVPEPRGQDGHEYALWDAAYVLGSLSDADRREFEAHLGECPSCRDAVTELSGMPAVLSLLDPSAAPSVEVSSTEVLITEQEVVFSTAAAVGVHRENIGRRLAAIMRRPFATATDASRPRPRYYPKRYDFLEHALMAREMDRL